MEIVDKISALVLEYGDKLGSYLIPALIALPIVLILFSRFSYNIFKFVFPIAGAVAGYFAGAKFLTAFVEKYFTGYKFIKPEYVAGAACALVLLIFCFKARKTAMLAIGATVGYLVIGKIAIDALNMIPFMNQVLTNTPEDKRTMFYFMISALCAIILMCICYRYFNALYIYSTSIAAAAAAIAVPAIFVFEKIPAPDFALPICAGVGAFIGFIFGCIQHSRNKYFYYN
jgi:hypothetical protein